MRMTDTKNSYDSPPNNEGTSQEVHADRDKRLSLLVEDLFSFVQEMDQAADKDEEK